MENKKSNKGLYIIIVILCILILGLGTYIIYDKLIANNQLIDSSNNSINDKANETVDEKQNNSLEKSYLGYWYESEQHSKDQNANSLNIKNVNGNKILMDLYITRTADFNGFEVTMNGTSGTFEASTDNGTSSDGQVAKINGNIVIYNNSIKLTITKSNVMYLNSETEYTFSYHIENSNIDNYKGTWYESEQHSKDQNSNRIIIKEIDNNKITFDFYITKAANFSDVIVYISNNYGTFEATSDNGPTSTGKLGKVTGYVQLADNTIKLVIGQTDIMYLNSGTKYTFTYQR
ncbi:MAG: hypothetical protein ACI31S_02925 [Bacilli bacterium]